MNCHRPILAGLALVLSAPAVAAQQNLNDLEMAHAAVTASNIDIAYGHLALALSENPAIRQFAETMIRDHSAVNAQVAALARRLNIEAKDNAFSRRLLQDAEGKKHELAGLRGIAFDRAYARNELAYHQAVNGVVEDAFLPAVRNPEVQQAFKTALAIFRGHEAHAERLVRQVEGIGR